MNWISTIDILPDNEGWCNDRVLFLSHNIVRVGDYDYESDMWTETGGGMYEFKNVTHWMLLPELPKDV